MLKMPLALHPQVCREMVEAGHTWGIRMCSISAALLLRRMPSRVGMELLIRDLKKLGHPCKSNYDVPPSTFVAGCASPNSAVPFLLFCLLHVTDSTKSVASDRRVRWRSLRAKLR